MSYGDTSVSSTGTSVSLTGLSAGTEYMFSVTATNSAGTGTGATDTVTTWQLPGAPRNFEASVTGTKTASLSWEAPNTGIPSTFTYTVSYGDTSVSSTGTSVNITDLTANDANDFSITAKNMAGSGPAEVIKVTTKPNPVDNLRVMTVFNRGFTIAWDQPTGGAASYVVKTQASQTGASRTVSVTGTTATFDDLRVGWTYTVSVTASGAGGTSLPQTITATTSGTPGMRGGPPIEVVQ